jgi:hypothetical protein
MNNPLAGTDPSGYACAGSRIEGTCNNTSSHYGGNQEATIAANNGLDAKFSGGSKVPNNGTVSSQQTNSSQQSNTQSNAKVTEIDKKESNSGTSTNVGGNWSSASHHEDPSKDSSTKTDEDGWHNPTGKDVRGCDKGGCGEFGASRKRDGKSVKGAHKGADYLGNEGQTIRAPHRGAVDRVIDKDKYGNPLDGVVVGDGKGNSWKMLYINHKLKKGDAVGGNQIIGTLNDLSKYGYPDYVPNHAHLKIRVNSKTVDPEEYIK